MLTKQYDLVVLGGGPGGYVAAIRASQLGMSVAIVEKDKLGGTCLHKGCIPTKSLLKSAEIYRQFSQADDFGIEASQVQVNFPKVQARKDAVVKKLYLGVQALMKKGKIDLFQGYGRILGPSIFSPMAGTISIEHDNGEENTMIVPTNVLIATGSSPLSLAKLGIDGEFILTSDYLLELEELPSSLTIVGGGVIGVEWASLLADFNVDVTIVEYADRLLPTMDKDISREMKRALENKDVKVLTSYEVISHEVNESKAEVTLKAKDSNDEEKQMTSEKVLVSVGRKANIDGIGLENTSIQVENRHIVTNEFFQTKESHIYAIGDVIGGLELAHVASHEGICAVEHMANEQPVILNDKEMPACVYSNPEIATIGYTEDGAREEGFDIQIGKFPLQANAKSLINGNDKGFVKVITDKETDDLLGVHMIGEGVTELIAEASFAKFVDGSSWEISHAVHPHPSLSEAMNEAAHAVKQMQIHS